MHPSFRKQCVIGCAGFAGGLIAFALWQQPLFVLGSALVAAVTTAALLAPVGNIEVPHSVATQLVAQFMTTPATTLPISLPLWRMLEWLETSPEYCHRDFPVVDHEGRLVGVASRSDLPIHFDRLHLGWLIVADIMRTQELTVAYATERLDPAVERMTTYGMRIVPVLDSPQQGRVIGVISQGDALRATRELRGAA